MRIEQLGETIADATPERVAQIALENRIIRVLRKRGPTKHSDLWFRASGVVVGRDVFERTVDELVERGAIVRESTTRSNSFILRMPNDKRRCERADAREKQAVQLCEPGEIR